MFFMRLFNVFVYETIMVNILIIIQNSIKQAIQAEMKNSLFNHWDGEDGKDRLISSCPLHCRHVRQAGFADNVKAIYFHAVYEEGCVY